MSAPDREECVYQAKLSEQAERYDEMVDAMRKVAKMNVALSVEERNLLSVAYKNVIGARRASWRIISSIEQKEEKQSDGKDVDPKLKLIKDYKEVMTKNVCSLCDEVISMISDFVIPSVPSDKSGDEDRVFYKKMLGDYYRYKAEVLDSDERKAASGECLLAYKAASEYADKLRVTNPIRLGLVLNFSVFYYEILNNPECACELASQAISDVVSAVDSAYDDAHSAKDTTLILQLLRDNLDLWKSDAQVDLEGGDQVEDLEDD